MRIKNIASGQIRKRIRRYGSSFEAVRYERESRQHLVADTNKSALISELARLEADEPNKADSSEYAAWREEMELLRAQIPKPDLRASLLAMTTTAAAYSFEHLETDPFDYVVFDEASQISLPYACALGVLGKKLLFAGDDKQLAPVVVSQHPTNQKLLSCSPFKYMRPDNRCQLDQQDRMAQEICELVANLFYDGKLYVDERSELDPKWQAERIVKSIPSIGRGRLHVEPCSTHGRFVTQAGAPGVFRHESAKRAVEIAKECVDAHWGTVVIITPFRKQRRDIEVLVRREGLKDVKVSTVHSVQGGEFHTVIFDPVLGEPIRDGGKLLSNAHEASRLVNVALSRAKVRFIILLSSDDRSNPVLQQLAETIEMHYSSDVEHHPISDFINDKSFPTKFVNRYVSHGPIKGKLLNCDNANHFIILTRTGQRKQFDTEMVRRKLAELDQMNGRS